MADIYYVTCPRGLIYIGMITRELGVRIQEHIKNIWAAAKMDAIDFDKLNKLKPNLK